LFEDENPRLKISWYCLFSAGKRSMRTIIVNFTNILNISAALKSRDAADTVFIGYPAGRISGLSKSRKSGRAGYRISSKCRIPDIRPDTWLDNYIFGHISNKFVW
jgi:hypothetical protein